MADHPEVLILKLSRHNTIFTRLQEGIYINKRVNFRLRTLSLPVKKLCVGKEIIFSPRFNPYALENMKRCKKFVLVSRFPHRYHRRLLPPIRPYHRIVALICNSSKGTHHPLSHHL
jgi:hypothetical protein